ncbi:M20/M25/M40 family metallo-hydrolase [Phreatobacter sp. AB_2022a]|uniref:M20/M25/M40 family metallo-hydrolase n=1 Tax=Phreatobacter sp. AB_2022a TaxID=3003134 RepID=UPI00228755FB|nr:M20/M25/M40 family metallo-hydrolase [Phreatobacter sp. AB_2022a]MCZ0737039.1 M20/M25/M40 family metallo-hydrolase [Phreatobacter sp. AB_2022a]
MTSSRPLEQVLANVDSTLDQSLERLFALLRIKSISTDSAYAKDCVEAAEWLAADLRTIGFAAEVRPTGGHPAVVAKSPGDAGRHALFYGHYDVQPVDPLNLWDTPPFEPSLATGPDGAKRILARGACDDKGQVMTFVEACRAWKAVTGSLPVGLTLLIEGEEESGSKHLFDFVRANKDDLKADVALVCDTGMWDSDTPAITTSLRGLVYEEVKVIAADRDLHSGVYGGAARNPIHVLGRIVGAIHGDDGRIAIPGFYDGVKDLPPDVKADWEGLGLTADAFLGPIGLSEPIGEKGRLLIEMIQSRPTCDVNGIIGGYTGEGTKTVIPSEASAKVSFRLVAGQDPLKIREAFHAFVRSLLPVDCKVEFISYKASPAIELPWTMPALTAARAALTAEWGRKAVTIGSGGSIPIVGDFKNVLGLDTLLVGFGLEDDRVHSPNEKYDLKSFHKGIRSWARILDALAQ